VNTWSHKKRYIPFSFEVHLTHSPELSPLYFAILSTFNTDLLEDWAGTDE